MDERVDKVAFIKSGTDFEEFSDIQIDLASREVKKQRVFITDQYKPDARILEHIELFTYELNKRLEHTCGHTAVDLEGRFEFLRTGETNMGNWLADLFYTEFDECDIVI